MLMSGLAQYLAAQGVNCEGIVEPQLDGWITTTEHFYDFTDEIILQASVFGRIQRLLATRWHGAAKM